MTSNKTSRIEVRAEEELVELIRRAAHAVHEPTSEFVRKAALHRADIVLRDELLTVMPAVQFEEMTSTCAPTSRSAPPRSSDTTTGSAAVRREAIHGFPAISSPDSPSTAQSTATDTGASSSSTPLGASSPQRMLPADGSSSSTRSMTKPAASTFASASPPSQTGPTDWCSESPRLLRRSKSHRRSGRPMEPVDVLVRLIRYESPSVHRCISSQTDSPGR